MKLGWRMGLSPEWTQFTFGVNSDKETDTEVVLFLFNITYVKVKNCR